MKKQIYLLLLLLIFSGASSRAQQVVFLTDEVDQELLAEEEITKGDNGNVTSISNVNVPSMTVYLPDEDIATGTAVIILPGGALRFLAWESEGTNVAKLLNEKGIAAFVLKYRLNNGDMPRPAAGATPPRRLSVTIDQFDQLKNANASPSQDAGQMEVLEKSATDTKNALKMIRERSDEWNIDPEKVGYLGFSAGGCVELGAVIGQNNKELLPNFIGSIYGPSMIDVVVPVPTPPIFIATAADHRNVAAGCLALFTSWKKAGGEAEMHIYSKGTGAFGTNKIGSTSDNWFDHFYSWMTTEGF
ncbi:MAG TPA: hypothetical protein VEP89_08485 [Draconibacterium sp.]|nr:hypothetical protein [Draconibacterium sp.]